MFKFITRKPLWVNVLTAVVALLLMLLIFLGSLALITKHGDTLRIPTVTGMSLEDAKNALEKSGFEVQIQDSIYIDSMKPLQVIKQFPDADNLVKVNRTVYLTINRSVAPMLKMPNLIGMSFRNAVLIMKQYGLLIEDTIFKPDFARNSILDQQYEGQPIQPGTEIRQGSKITLVLGNGVGGYEIPVPNFVGLHYSDALALLSSNQLVLGAPVPDPDVTDTLGAFVYRQSPSPYDPEEKKTNHIRPGQAIDFWLSVKPPEKKTDSAVSSQPQP